MVRAVKKRNPVGEDIDLPENTQVFFVNTKFRDASYGFLMTFSGIVVNTAPHCDMNPEEIKRFAKLARERLLRGDKVDKRVKFNM